MNKKVLLIVAGVAAVLVLVLVIVFRHALLALLKDVLIFAAGALVGTFVVPLFYKPKAAAQATS